MAVKDQFTTEEWSKVVSAPIAAGMYMVLASPGLTSIVGETRAMMQAITQGEKPAGAADIINAIIADLQSRAEGSETQAPQMPENAEKDPAAAKRALMADLTAASAAVAANSSQETTKEFNQWLYSVALAVAEAAKEGGFMGIGGERVSDKEKAALDELKGALSL